MLGLGAALSALVALSIGRGSDPISAALVLVQIVQWALPGLAMLISAAGLGVLARGLVRGSADRPALAMGVGVSILAAIGQVAGCLGLLGTTAVAIGLLAPGWAAAVWWLWRMRSERLVLGQPPAIAWAAVAPVGVLAAAACAPPGWLWASEFGGFDALSYHLQLPQEWHASGRIVPLTHNVYSFLPGSFEAMVTHLAAFTGAPRIAPEGGGGFGLVAGTGWRLISAQFLHAWLAILAAWLVGRAARGAASAAGADASASRDAGWIAGVLVLATPWTIVVGSLAYTEMPMLALGACGLVAALDRGLPAWRRGLVAGVLVGAACGFKPTAMLYFTPGIGLILLATAPARSWPAMIGAGCVAGVVMLLPWLTRNALVGGNPVFPFASGLFGSAHWSVEQVARYAAAHSFEGSALDRLRLLVLPDPGASPSARDVERLRGATNPQYGIVLAAAVLSIAPAIVRWGRPAALVAAMLGLGFAAWLSTGHLQSRFLIPVLLPGCVLLGLGLGGPPALSSGAPRALLAWGSRRISAWVVAGVGVVLLCVGFAGERGGGPNEVTLAGPATFTGELSPDPIATATATINRLLPAGSRVMLLGDATPIYCWRVPVWSTTWDGSRLTEAIRRGPDDADAWVSSLRAEGITHILVNLSELGRYQRSGAADPSLTPERVGALLERLGEPIAGWEATRQVLFALGPEGEQ